MIEFIEDYRVKPDGPDYAKGERQTMRRASEDHFIRKGVAVKVEAVTEPVAAKKSDSEIAAVIAEAAADQAAANEEMAELLSALPLGPASPGATAKPRGKSKLK